MLINPSTCNNKQQVFLLFPSGVDVGVDHGETLFLAYTMANANHSNLLNLAM